MKTILILLTTTILLGNWQKDYNKCLEFLKAEEGFKSKAYRCSQGALTIGYGHKLLKTDNIKSITKQQAEQLLISDFEKAIARIYETFSGIEDKQLFSYAVLSFQTGM